MRAAFGYQFDARADAVAIALCSFESNIKPVIRGIAAIHPYLRVLANRRHHGIDAPVAVKVSKGATAMARRRKRAQSGFVRKKAPFARAPRIAEDKVGLIDVGPKRHQGQDVAATDKDILPSIVIEVVDANAKAGAQQAGLAHAADSRYLDELFPCAILKERKSLIGQRRKGNVRVAVVVDIAKVEPHA